MLPNRRDLPEAVRAALRTWHTPSPAGAPWCELLVVKRDLDASAASDTGTVVKRLLFAALNALESQSPLGAQILRLRFLERLTAAETARHLNLSQDIVYKRQHDALDELSGVVWQLEQQARLSRELRVTARLDLVTAPRLFGVGNRLDELRRVLVPDSSPWLIALVGIGGIGKTSLADAAVRELVCSPAFADIAWVAARQQRCSIWGSPEDLGSEAPALSVDGLLDALVEQLGFHELNGLPQAQKADLLRTRLRVRPYLLVVDNLETAADCGALLPTLRSFANPTKILLTARHSLHQVPGTLNLSLDELTAEDSLALLRHEAGERGLSAVASAPDSVLLPIYEVTGGNPLALKLLVGHMHALPIARIVDDLRQARGRQAEDLYRFIYWRSWHLLGEPARRALSVMPLVAESGCGLEQLSTLAEMADDEVASALGELAAFCLVSLRGSPDSPRYGIHRLTETFLLSEVLKWQAAP